MNALAVVPLFLLASYAQATNYYVHYTAGSDSNSGKATNAAWKTVGKVNGVTFAPGDVIAFARGETWSGTTLVCDNNGAVTSGATNFITYTAYGPALTNPVITYPGGYSNNVTPPYTGTDIIITNLRRGIVIDANYVKVEDFLVRNVNEAGIYIVDWNNKGNSNIVQNCEVTDCGEGIKTSGNENPVSGQYNLIRSNYLHDLRIQRATAGGGDDTGAVGIDIQSSHNEVAYNRMINCRAACADFGGFDGGAVEFFNGSGNYTDGNYIHHNYAENCEGFVEVGGNVADSRCNDSVFAYNVIVNNYGDLCYLHLPGDPSWGVDVNNLQFYNNTIYDTTPGTGWFIATNGDPLNGTTPRVVLRNNIFYSNKKAITFGQNALKINSRYNIFFRTDGGTLEITPGTGDKIVDPQFVNGSSKDFHLKSTSPAIDAGTNLNYPLDFDGKLVPRGPAPDMGAYEYHISQALELSACTWLAGGRFQITLSGDSGFCYNIEVSSNCAAWQRITNVPNYNGSVLVVDSGAQSLPKRFYRAALAQ